MDRRGFLKSLGLVAGGVALDQAVPLGRVWSFPTQIVIAQPPAVRLVKLYSLPANRFLTIEEMQEWTVRHLRHYHGAIALSP